MSRKSERVRLPRQVAKIKRLNACFKKLRDEGASQEQLDRIMDEKDHLIDEMASECGHEDVIEPAGDEFARRICLRCGYGPLPGNQSAQDSFFQLPVRVLSDNDFAIQLGLALKRLGINL
jgi:hypothetical protein